MNGFKYNSTLIKLLTTMANMLIVSFFWILTSLPLLTIISSSAALYKTCIRCVFVENKAEPVTPTYFKEFKDSLKQGVLLSLAVLAAAFFVYTGLDTGRQIYTLGALGMAYLVLGIVITAVFLAGIIYLPPVLSRFEVGFTGSIRLALYLSSIHLFQTLWYILLLCALVYTINLFPPIILIVPALYVDLIRVGVETKILRYIKENGLDQNETKNERTRSSESEDSLDIEKKLAKKKHG